MLSQNVEKTFHIMTRQITSIGLLGLAIVGLYVYALINTATL